MAVTKVVEQFDRRRSTYREGTVLHIRAFLVTTDDVADGTAVAYTAVDPNDSTSYVPQPGEPLLPPGVTSPVSNAIYPIVTGIDADVWNGDSNHFQVLVEYSLNLSSSDNPLNAPVELSYTYNEGTEQVFLDTSDPPKPYANSAGDPFEQFYERENGMLVIQITRNVTSFNPVLNDTYKHTVNQGAVVIDGVTYAAGTCKLSPITATRQTATITMGGALQTLIYYRQTMTVKAKHEGWDHSVQDMGFNERIGTPGAYALKQILDSGSLPIKKPWPLDGTGKKQPSIDATPATITLHPYVKKDWSGLTFA